jgi:hypothetical protein
MALSSDERIQISKKMVTAASENAALDIAIAQIAAAKVPLVNKDNAHKSIIEGLNIPINAYQVELTKYDGNTRIQLTNTDFTNAASKSFQNYFFPNDAATALPSLASGLWPNFVPFAKSAAIGKKYTETYDIVPGETSLISSISSQITIMEGYSAIRRSTGQTATDPLTIATDPLVQAAATSIKNAVDSWQTLLSSIVVYSSETDNTKAAQNVIASNSKTSPLSIIGVWKALLDFDTNHGQTTQATFEAYDVSLLQPTKFRAAELLPLKNLLINRQAYLVTRMAELNVNLGTIVQASDGSITSSSGLYGNRYNWISMRLHLLSGSLAAITNMSNAQNAQTQMQTATTTAANMYGTILKTTALRAPASGTSTIQVMDSTGFSVGNTVYLVGEQLDEITAVIQSISANAIFLNVEISKKYTRDVLARLYKVL